MVKHNKLKNSGLLFELLVRQMTTDTLNGIKESKSASLLKRYFQDTELLKEYHIYDIIAKSRNLTESKANLLLTTCIEAYSKLNKKALREKKYNLVAEIKEVYNIDDFFKIKVPNYKTMASVYLLLEINNSDDSDINQYVSCKNTLMEHLVSTIDKKTTPLMEEFSQYDKGTRILVYKTFVKRFNEKYQSLNEAQKSILKEYLNTPTNSPRLKEVCNTEISTIQKQLKVMQKDIADDSRKVKLQEISKLITTIPANRTVQESDITNILHYQELLKEYDNLETK